MKNIIIGKAGTHNVGIDLETLLSTRMLVTADSGGGKTFALKRLRTMGLIEYPKSKMVTAASWLNEI